MEAGHDAALGETIVQTALHQVLHDLGASDPGASAQAIMACAEGLILHRVARHDETDLRPALALVVRAALS